MSATVTCRGIDAMPDALLRELAAAGFGVGPPTPLAATVLDTFDGRLHDAGLRLERRGDTLVLVGPGTSAASLPVDGDATVRVRAAARSVPGPPRRRHRDPHRAAGRQLNATTRRAERRNGDDKVVAAVTIHQRIAVDGAG